MSADVRAKGGSRTRSPQALSAARLAAVQAVYEVESTNASVEAVLAGFSDGRWRHLEADDAALDVTQMAPPDQRLLTELVSHTVAAAADLEAKIGPHLSGSYSVIGLEAVLRATLKVAAYELTRRLEVPAKVVISEYMDIAHAFFSEREPALVNAVLDKIAREARPAEFDALKGAAGLKKG